MKSDKFEVIVNVQVKMFIDTKKPMTEDQVVNDIRNNRTRNFSGVKEEIVGISHIISSSSIGNEEEQEPIINVDV